MPAVLCIERGVPKEGKVAFTLTDCSGPSSSYSCLWVPLESESNWDPSTSCTQKYTFSVLVDLIALQRDCSNYAPSLSSAFLQRTEKKSLTCILMGPSSGGTWRCFVLSVKSSVLYLLHLKSLIVHPINTGCLLIISLVDYPQGRYSGQGIREGMKSLIQASGRLKAPSE